MRLLNSLRETARWAAAHRPGYPGRSTQQRRLRIKRSLSRRSLLIFLVALAGVLVWRVGLTSAGGGRDKQSRTYTVLVGAEDATQGASVVAFFPDTLTIHVGDTVHWQRNTNEIHTVTFLAGTPLPPFNVPAPPGLPSNLMRNPLIAYPVAPGDGLYDGTAFATSGIFGPDADLYEVDAFDLTFTTPGTYDYVCDVHGARMSGQIIVVDDREHVPPPHQVARQAQAAIAQALAQVPDAVANAEAEVPPPTRNDDGTTAYYVLVGYTLGDQLDLLRFFPDNLTVQPGDTVEWVYNLDTMTMVHTITFLNGTPPPDDLIPVPQDDGPPLLVVNPEIVYPQNADQPLTRDGVYSSGQLRLANPPPTFSLVIGDISGEEPYRCLIHDGSGMLATLNIVPR
jgi:plastocyanin